MEVSFPLRLAGYAKAGGTVALCSMYSSYTLLHDVEFIFEHIWELLWRPVAYTSEDVVVNPRMKRLSTPLLVKKYCMKAMYVDNVALSDAVHPSPPSAKRLARRDVAEEQQTATYRTTAAFTTVGKGRLGYVGHANVGHNIAIKTICAM